MTDYIVGFSERYTPCADVDANEALFVVQGEAARLVVPRVCQKVLFDEAHCGHVAAHFGARRMYALLVASVWWPNMRKSC